VIEAGVQSDDEAAEKKDAERAELKRDLIVAPRWRCRCSCWRWART
jgi:hypothetical protein